MNVYPPIIDAHSLVQLKKDVEYFNPSRNHWIGINDEPENTIEKYIQDSFDFYLADSFSSTIVKGFEWWVQVFTGDDGIPFHDNHDENLRIETGEKRYPLSSTITYLTNNTSPTIILNDNEVIFSVPEEGKFLECDPRYIRGVHPNNNKGRITLCYDVWHYKPEGLERIGINSVLFPCRFYKNTEVQPVTWLGKVKECTSNVYDKVITFKYPTTYKEGETWKVIQ
jgi:hypothetical protein